MAVFLVRRLLLGLIVLLALSYGTYWFFAANFFNLTGDTASPTALWWDWLQGVPSLRSFTSSHPVSGGRSSCRRSGTRRSCWDSASCS